MFRSPRGPATILMNCASRAALTLAESTAALVGGLPAANGGDVSRVLGQVLLVAGYFTNGKVPGADHAGWSRERGRSEQ